MRCCVRSCEISHLSIQREKLFVQLKPFFNKNGPQTKHFSSFGVHFHKQIKQQKAFNEKKDSPYGPHFTLLAHFGVHPRFNAKNFHANKVKKWTPKQHFSIIWGPFQQKALISAAKYCFFRAEGAKLYSSP